MTEVKVIGDFNIKVQNETKHDHYNERIIVIISNNNVNGYTLKLHLINIYNSNIMLI